MLHSESKTPTDSISLSSRKGSSQVLSNPVAGHINTWINLSGDRGITEGDDLIQYVSTELTVDDFRRTLASQRERAWIAETSAGKCAVGYALAVSDDGAKLFSSFELKRLYVFYRFHGNGLGKRLLGDVLAFAREMKSERIWLEVHEANHHAREFYKHCGCFAPARVLTMF